MNDLRPRLHALVADEPAWTAQFDDVLRRASRQRTRQAVVAGGCAAGVVSAAFVVASALPADDTAELAGPPPASATPIPGSSAEPAPSAAPHIARAVEDALRRHLGAEWKISAGTGVVSDSDAGRTTYVGIEATIDDGRGEARLSGGVMLRAGDMQLHPCKDGEFVGAGRCTEHALSDGSRLVLRQAADNGPLRDVRAAIVHPDGTGTSFEASNGYFPELRTHAGAPGAERRDTTPPTPPSVRVTREEPALTAAQLGDLARAVDAAARRNS